MFDGQFRAQVEKGLRPVGANIRRTGLTADHLTALGLVFALACAVSLGFGHPRLGLLFLVLAAVPDLLDGAVAKASGTASPRGAFFDSVADRVSDALVLGGITAWFIADDRGMLILLPVAVMATSFVISYERARAESLGFDARGGLMERAERIILIGLGLLFDVLLVPILAVMLVLTLVTAGQRFAKVWAQASVERPGRSDRRQRARRRARTRSRARDRGAWRSGLRRP